MLKSGPGTPITWGETRRGARGREASPRMGRGRGSSITQVTRDMDVRSHIGGGYVPSCTPVAG